MVDALHAAAGALRPRGEIVDLRPAPGREPRILSRGRVVGHLITHAGAAEDDAAADAAVDRAVGERVVRRVARGHLWYQIGFEDLKDLDDYLENSSRFAADVSPEARAILEPRRTEPITLRRALAYQVLARAPG